MVRNLKNGELIPGNVRIGVVGCPPSSRMTEAIAEHLSLQGLKYEEGKSIGASDEILPSIEELIREKR